MNISIKPVFSFNLNQKTSEAKVTIGKYDGTHACLTAATTADKVNHKSSIQLIKYHLNDST